jgi:hypothetical protein
VSSFRLSEQLTEPFTVRRASVAPPLSGPLGNNEGNHFESSVMWQVMIFPMNESCSETSLRQLVPLHLKHHRRSVPPFQAVRSSQQIVISESELVHAFARCS